MKTLDLVLKYKWYDMVDSGVKTEEYREFKPYWWKRIWMKDFNYVKFHRGYTSTTMTFKAKYVIIGRGNREWGAPKDLVFIIKLGKRVVK